MNNMVIAQLDDLQISARLAKVCSTHSYDLHFWEKDTDFPANLNKSVLIQCSEWQGVTIICLS